ncbi:MAG: hypothetical protein JKY57_06525 [Kordiimonadaceae bacterium]|nr:hypothetical protein [Kordiimonadaceae bacterium]
MNFQLLGRLVCFSFFSIALLASQTATVAAETLSRQQLSLVVQDAFTDIESLSMASAQELNFLAASYGHLRTMEPPYQAVTTDWITQINTLKKTIQESHIALLAKLRLIDTNALEITDSAVQSQTRLFALTKQLETAYQGYGELSKTIHADINGQNFEIYRMRQISRAMWKIFDTANAIQLHLLHDYAPPEASAALHLRASLLWVHQFTQRETANLAYNVASGHPIGHYQKSLGLSYHGRVSTAFVNVEAIAHSSHIPTQTQSYISNIQELTFDRLQEIHFELYDLSEDAIDEAPDPDEVKVDYDTTPDEWITTANRSLAPVVQWILDLQKLKPTVPVVEPSQPLDLNTILLMLGALLFIGLVVIVTQQKNAKKNQPHVVAKDSQHLVKNMQEIAALSGKINWLSKQQR